MQKRDLRIDVAGIPYRIVKVDNPELDGSKCAGLCDSKLQLITLNKSYGGERLEQILMHEIIHAIANEFVEDIWDNEKIVSGMAIGIHEFLKRNDIYKLFKDVR
jgi:hypothetical protein